jgi:L-fuculose-phosphate aldolase
MVNVHADLKQEIIIAGKVLVEQGQDDFTRGHISVRLPDNPSLFFMKPHSIGFDEMTVDNILTIDLDGNVVEGTSRRHSEVFIHSEIYKARADVQSVLHTHPTYAVALSASDRPMRALSQPSTLFYEALGLYDGSINLIRSVEMGARVALTLGPHRAVLLKNHGAVTATISLKETVISMIMLENAAHIQLIGETAGNTRPEFPRADIEKLKGEMSKPEHFAINFDYLARRVSRTTT